MRLTRPGLIPLRRAAHRRRREVLAALLAASAAADPIDSNSQTATLSAARASRRHHTPLAVCCHRAGTGSGDASRLCGSRARRRREEGEGAVGPITAFLPWRERRWGGGVETIPCSSAAGSWRGSRKVGERTKGPYVAPSGFMLVARVTLYRLWGALRRRLQEPLSTWPTVAVRDRPAVVEGRPTKSGRTTCRLVSPCSWMHAVPTCTVGHCGQHFSPRTAGVSPRSRRWFSLRYVRRRPPQHMPSCAAAREKPQALHQPPPPSPFPLPQATLLGRIATVRYDGHRPWAANCRHHRHRADHPRHPRLCSSRGRPVVAAHPTSPPAVRSAAAATAATGRRTVPADGDGRGGGGSTLPFPSRRPHRGDG